MSDSVISPDGRDGGSPEAVYEPPTLKPIGNVRDLLAGATGSFDDAFDPGNSRQQNP